MNQELGIMAIVDLIKQTIHNSLFIIQRYKIFGKSMEPVLADGSFIIGERLTYCFRDPKAGDVVIFNEPGSKILAVKKVVAATKQEYEVLGINREASLDSRHYGAIHREDIVAKAMAM